MDFYIAAIMGWGPTWAPRAWTLCAGQLLAISQYSAVFSLIGTIYGGDGRTTFRLPDLRGRAPIGAGQSPGTSFHAQGAMQGSEYHTLSVLEMPVHNHSANTQGLTVFIEASTTNASSATPATGNTLGTVVDATSFGDIHVYGTGAPDVALAGGAIAGNIIIGNTGGSQSFSIVQPIQAIQYIFCLQGIFPPRN